MIIEKYTDMAGKIRVIWQAQSGQIYQYKFDTDPTDQMLVDLGNASDTAASVNAVQPLTLSILAYEGTLKSFVKKVKDTPNVTLAQYNTYLGALPWYDAAIIRTFVFLIAQRLSEKKDIVLSDQTEAITLRAVRDFLVATPGWKLARLILNQNDL
jgi:hypothetical protein